MQFVSFGSGITNMSVSPVPQTQRHSSVGTPDQPSAYFGRGPGAHLPHCGFSSDPGETGIADGLRKAGAQLFVEVIDEVLPRCSYVIPRGVPEHPL